MDRYFIVLAALRALAAEGIIESKEITKALQMFDIKADQPDPALS